MLVEKTVKDFLAEVGSNSPAPGGGSVSALAGALGANLAAMVCRLTVNNEKYAEVQPQIKEILAAAEKLGGSLTVYVDKDTEAFNVIMNCFKMPKATDAEKEKRSQAIQEATQNASTLPLNVAASCADVLELAVRVLVTGNKTAASDAAVAGLSAYAGVYGALYNVKINLGSIKDEGFKSKTSAEAAAVKTRADRAYQALLAKADEVMG